MFNNFFWKTEIEWNHDVDNFSHFAIIFWWKKSWIIFQALKISLKTTSNACSILTEFIRSFFMNSFWFGFSNWDLTIRHFVFFWTRNSMKTCYHFFFKYIHWLCIVNAFQQHLHIERNINFALNEQNQLLKHFWKLLFQSVNFLNNSIKANHALCASNRNTFHVKNELILQFYVQTIWKILMKKIIKFHQQRWWNKFFQFFNFQWTTKSERIVVWHDWTNFQSFFSHCQCSTQTEFNSKIQ